MLDIDGTPQQLRDLVSRLQAHIEGDKLAIPPTARRFATREEAVATLSDLFEQDEEDHIDDCVH